MRREGEVALGPRRMLSGLGLGGSWGGNLFKSGSDDWPVCAGHAHTLMMDSFLPARSACGRACAVAARTRVQGNPGRSSAQVSWGLVAAVTAGKEAPLRPPRPENQTLAFSGTLKW